MHERFFYLSIFAFTAFLFILIVFILCLCINNKFLENFQFITSEIGYRQFFISAADYGTNHTDNSSSSSASKVNGTSQLVLLYSNSVKETAFPELSDCPVVLNFTFDQVQNRFRNIVLKDVLEYRAQKENQQKLIDV